MLATSATLRRGKGCQDKVLGGGGSRWCGLAESQSPSPFSQAGLLMGQLQPFIHPFTLKCNNRKGGGADCGEMGLCACAGWMWMKSKGIPKYQRDEVHQPGPMPLLTNTCSYTLSPNTPPTPPLAPSMLWASIRNTKGLSTLFDHYMHFHHSALFCLYSQAGGYKELLIHPGACLTACCCSSYCHCCFL